ncbi:hypothetical protein NQ317_014910 [Molorchus minor]|uniref:Uncharacterized protein n=1 Tax=Molorchus minor TaxID=1323400 RepID=A0ABQ9IZI8_9CUCU|nr:hypothetical protein NQ317_014910 [Molorchus minor]
MVCKKYYRSNDWKKDRALKEKIQNLVNSIRKKYVALKLGKAKEEETIDRLLKPVIDPIKELKTLNSYIRNLTPPMPEKEVVKYLPRHFENNIRDIILIQGIDTIGRLTRYLKGIDEGRKYKRWTENRNVNHTRIENEDKKEENGERKENNDRRTEDNQNYQNYRRSDNDRRNRRKKTRKQVIQHPRTDTGPSATIGPSAAKSVLRCCKGPRLAKLMTRGGGYLVQKKIPDNRLMTPAESNKGKFGAEQLIFDQAPKGVGAPQLRAELSASPRSLAIRLTLNPPLYPLEAGTFFITPGTGLYVSELHDLADDTFMMEVSNFGSNPNFTPMFKASEPLLNNVEQCYHASPRHRVTVKREKQRMWDLDTRAEALIEPVIINLRDNSSSDSD